MVFYFKQMTRELNVSFKKLENITFWNINDDMGGNDRWCFRGGLNWKVRVWHSYEKPVTKTPPVQFQIRGMLFGKREETDIDRLSFKFKAVSMDTALLLCDREWNNHVACGSDMEPHMYPTFTKWVSICGPSDYSRILPVTRSNIAVCETSKPHDSFMLYPQKAAPLTLTTSLGLYQISASEMLYYMFIEVCWELTHLNTDQTNFNSSNSNCARVEQRQTGA